MENHILSIERREKITVTSVVDADSFNEETILLVLEKGGLVIKGQKLHVQMLDLAQGKAVITGDIQSAVYTEKKNKGEDSLLKKIFR